MTRSDNDSDALLVFLKINLVKYIEWKEYYLF